MCLSLKDLEIDFCKDLLADTSDALRWLDNANRSECGKEKINKLFYI